MHVYTCLLHEVLTTLLRMHQLSV